jgi:hypothetical protein
MRRSITLFSLFVAAAVSVLAVAGPAGAARLSPRTVCPQIVPCCPVPVNSTPATAHATPVCCPGTGTCCTTATCCTTTTCCSTGTCCTATPCPSGNLTIASSANPSTAGRKVVISGVLTASPVSGAQVDLWRERVGQSSFNQVAQTTTSSSGTYSFTLKAGTVMADQEWYVTSGALRSGTIDQRVRALVALTASTHTIPAGRAVVLRGHVTPSHAGEAVLIEKWDQSTRSWHVIARPRLSKGSTYSLSHRFAQSGKSKLKAVLALDARNLASSSPTVTLTVT